MSLCLLSYLGGMLNHASVISCGSDAVMCLVMGWIFIPLPHDIVQMLMSSHLNRNLSICHLRHRFCCRHYRPFLRFISTLGNAVYSRLLHLFFVVSILGIKGTTPCLPCLFSRHNNSGSSGMIRLIFLGGGWPDDVWFPCRSEDSSPLAVIWAEDVSIMRQAMML